MVYYLETKVKQKSLLNYYIKAPNFVDALFYLFINPLRSRSGVIDGSCPLNLT